ncbi:MAG TPA: MASE3 domain-containing protein, partial [Desulfatiglandales bacterium]|nr:MASE3 domain-containing protein [Desulfatiglandales bacterium]
MPTKPERLISRSYQIVISSILLLFGLYLTSLFGYLLFHSTAEVFSIVVACGIFMVAWNSRRFLDNNYLLFIGIAYLFVALLDLVHTLAYRGMGVFPGYATNLPTQLWIAARYMESVSLLLAPLFIRRRLYTSLTFFGYVAISAFLLSSILVWNVFPDCFIEGQGLSSFKKASEYIISLILLISTGLLMQRREAFDEEVLQLLVGSLLLTIGSELFFTFYVHAYGLSNLIGHFFKIISFYLMYRAIIQTGLVRPYDLLFRNLKQREEQYRAIVEDQTELVCRFKPKMAVTFVNEAFCKYFGK